MFQGLSRRTLTRFISRTRDPRNEISRKVFALITLAALLVPVSSLAVRSAAAGANDSRANESSSSSPVANPVVPVITATKADALFTDVNGNLQADGGDTLKYTVVITNGGSSDATNVVFNDTVDANSTLVPGSVSTTPIARNDTYSATGNVQISIGAGSGLLANDSDADLNSLSASAGTSSTQGGNVSVSADGSFTYNPPAGFEGNDTFNYTITDGSNMDTATASITVSDMIWFVNAGAGGGGDGRLTAPFNALTGAGSFDAVAGDDPGDFIFLYSGNYTGGLTLLSNQGLIGAGATVSLSQATGITPPTGSLSLPSTGGANPVVTSTSNGVNVGTDNLLRGFTIGNKTGIGIAGSGLGTLTVREVAVNGTGQALGLSSGALDAGFSELSSTNSAVTGLSLSSVTGTLSTSSTTISNPTGVGISVITSGAVLDFSTTSVTGSGGTGVVLSSNTGNVSFGDFDIAPDAGQRSLFATSNTVGTISSTSGTLTSSNAITVEIDGVSSVNRTPLALVLDSVSASNAANGIVLSSTSGSFSVNGSGSGGSGGTIQNITNRGASFIDTTNITLKSMNFVNAATTNGAVCASLTVAPTNLNCNAAIHLVNTDTVVFDGLSVNGSVQQGINGNNVSNFSMNNSEVQNAGDAADENGMQFVNLLGTSSITSSNIHNNKTHQLAVQNNSSTPGTLTVSSSTFANSVTPVGGDGIRFNTDTNGNNTIDIQNSSFTSNFLSGYSSNAINNSSVKTTISGSSFTNNFGGISISTQNAANSVYTILNNPTNKGNAGNAININLATPSAGTLQGTINNNVIGDAAVVNSGSTGGSGIRVVSNGAAGSLITAITNNTVNNIQFGSGIDVLARDGNNSLSATITDNVVNMNSAASTNGITAVSGAVSGDTASLCADIRNNNIANNSGGDELRVRQRFSTTLRLPGFVPVGPVTTTQINTFLAGQNTLNGGSVSSTIQAPGTVTGGAPCAAPIAMREGGSSQTQYMARVAVPVRSISATMPVASVTAKQPALNTREATARTIKANFNHGGSIGARRDSATTPMLTSMPSGETINLNIGSLPAGKSVTITFLVTLNNSAPPGVTSVSNQGTVSGSNFSPVLTDDPDTGAANDPTVTPVNFTIPPDITCPANIIVNADPGTCSASVAFNVTATGSPTPTVDCKIGATSITSPHTFPGGTTTVQCTATNGAPPDDSCSFTVTVNDVQAPVITINGANPMTIECHTTFTDPGATALDACAGSTAVMASSNVNANVPGTYSVVYTTTDGTNSASATRTVIVVDTTPPVITLNGANPMTVQCHTAFVDPGATATDSCAGNLTGSILVTGTVNTNVPGSYTVTYSVSDGTNTVSVTRTVNVVDTGVPVINLNGTPHTMWPPNHNYETFNVTDFVSSVTDSCNTTLGVSSVVISKVTSDEVENGNGDGNTLNDIIIAANCKSVQLRSERDGSGNGRVYIVTFKVTDSNGNVGTATATVTVPKSQGNGGAAVDSGPHYTVNGTCP